MSMQIPVLTKNYGKNAHSPTIFGLCRLGRQRIRHETCDRMCSNRVTILKKCVENFLLLLVYMYIHVDVLQTSEVVHCTWLPPHARHWQHLRSLTNKYSQHYLVRSNEQHSLSWRAEKRASISLQVWSSPSRLVRSPITSSCRPSVTMAVDN